MTDGTFPHTQTEREIDVFSYMTFISRNARTILPRHTRPADECHPGLKLPHSTGCGTSVGLSRVGKARPRGASRRLHLEDVVELEAEVLTVQRSSPRRRTSKPPVPEVLTQILTMVGLELWADRARMQTEL